LSCTLLSGDLSGVHAIGPKKLLTHSLTGARCLFICLAIYNRVSGHQLLSLLDYLRSRLQITLRCLQLVDIFDLVFTVIGIRCSCR